MHATAVIDLPAKTTVKTSIFDANNPGFKEDFDEKPFEFKHCFPVDHPMFKLPRIRKILEHPVLKHHAYYDHGAISVDQRWETIPERKLTAVECFDRIEGASGWGV